MCANITRCFKGLGIAVEYSVVMGESSLLLREAAVLQVVVEGSVKRRASKVRHGTGGLCIATSELAVDVGASLGAKLADLAAADSAA